MNLSEILSECVKRDASDIHLKVGRPPVYRVRRDLQIAGTDPLTSRDLEEMVSQIISGNQKEFFRDRKEVDLAYNAAGIGRFRVNIFREKGNPSLVMRWIRTRIPNFKELSLPPIMEKIASFPRGIVLVSGTSCSGKSTTLAAMIEYINERRRCHIVTIEDPIEYMYDDKQAVIVQREMGLDTDSFGSALRYVIRQDPDIILVGEMRDSDTFQAAISASETGHLVFTTLHSSDVSQVIDRVMDFFPASQRQQIKMQLALNLRAIISQRLMVRAGGDGLIPAVEILINTPSVTKLIREDKLNKLYNAMQGGAEDGMQTFNQSLVKLVNGKLITEEEALSKSTHPEALKMNIKGIYLDDDRRILGA